MMKMLRLAVAVSSTFALSAALAGECPADKRVADGQGQKMVNYGPKDVTDKVRASVDLAKEAPELPGRLFRLRGTPQQITLLEVVRLVPQLRQRHARGSLGCFHPVVDRRPPASECQNRRREEGARGAWKSHG